MSPHALATTGTVRHPSSRCPSSRITRSTTASAAQREAELGGLAGEELVRNLHQHAGAVAGTRVASAGPTMGQVVEHLESLLQDVVRAHSFDVDHKADAACVVLVSWIVEALARGDAAQLVHRYVLFDSPNPFLRAPWRWRRPLPGSLDSSACTAICVRSVCVDSTTIVSVRVTPSTRRMVRMSSSSVVVLAVLTLSSRVCSPVM